ncbi:probable peroxisomal acyl-coenzyme A oxidase 1 isoform X2 [Aricia agestis]|uniref:probable peroxisomal acyl-coenzyme A oxidase 1 isoform X2 n=1 Tax=Aricia agestis TaxID=91739 RepID=UPI001C20323F|nr:probable peroxisomal acyl-coenzyme A oxidase 1 isoform X2 [Aricia agestis]
MQSVKQCCCIERWSLTQAKLCLYRSHKSRFNFRNSIASAIFKEGSPLMLHFGMFIPAIQGQGTEEQIKKWLKRAINMEIIGTYAQTELGHGTFIRGLETTATYDAEKEEFVLNSPTLTAYKWWPGGLAHTANHCVVMAQLYTKGKNCGIQAFLVQIRDEETHMPLPGVKLGEIGAKFNFNTVNNGFLGFENHRIPRDRMLMKSAQVLKDGTFKASSNPKLVYGTMVYVRVIIVNTASSYLARAATIALRYSALRRQSKLKANEPEIQVLDYLTQQHKLFIAVATSYAYFFSARWVWRLYKKVTMDMQQGQVDRLPELHVLACSLKVLSSADCSSLIERCRLACGGHGYTLASDLPQLYALCSAICTYEGENTVLLLQVARSLVKAWEQAHKGATLSPSMAYLSDRSPVSAWDSSVDGIIRSFQKVSVGKLSEAVRSLKENSQKMSPEDAWNMTSVQLIAAAEAHARAVVLSIFKMEVENSMFAASAELRGVMTSLLELYVVYWALEKTGDLLLFAKLSEADVRALQRRYERLLTEVRPNAVGLVDAYDFRDEVLNSALGAYDGNAYERLMAEAMKSPLNQEPVNQTFHKYLKPFMRGKL